MQDYLNSAQSYKQSKQFKSAIIELKNAIKLDDHSSDARYLLGQIYLDSGDGHSAKKEFNRALEYGHPYAMVAAELGQAYLQADDSEGLLKEITINRDLDDSLKADLAALRAQAYLQQGKMGQAQDALEQAKKSGVAQPLVRLALAQYDNSNQAYSNIEPWLTPLLDRNDRFAADGWSLMGEVAQKQSRYDEAIAAYAKAIEIRNIVSADNLRLALLYITTDQFELAQQELKRVKGTKQDIPVVIFSEGLIAYKQENMDQAAALFEKTLNIDSAYKPALLYHGLTSYRRNNYQSAVKSLQSYLLTHPHAYEATLITSAAFIKQQEFDKAVELLRGLHVDMPTDHRVNSLLGNALILSGDLEGGIDRLQQALLTQPADATTRMQLGQAFLKQGEVTIGNRELTKAIELDSRLLQADLSLYLSFMKSKQYDKAIKVAQQLETKRTDQSIAANLVALAYLADKQQQIAVTTLKQALVKYPGDPLTANNLAQFYLKEGEFDRAESYYLAILDKQPRHLKSLTQLAILASKKGDIASVEQWLLKAVAENPFILLPKILLATHYLQQKDYLAATQLLQEVDQSDQQQAAYLLLKAKLKLAVKEPQHAVRILRQLLGGNPKSIAGHYLLAQAYAANGQGENVKTTLEQGLAINPQHLPSNIVLARLLLMEKDTAPAKRLITQLSNIYPKHPSVIWLQAQLAQREGHNEFAIEQLQVLMQQMPQTELAIDVATSQWKSGDSDGAIATLELWSREHPEDTRILLTLAQFYMAKDRYQDAQKAYLELEKVQPDNADLLNNLAWLLRIEDVGQALKYAKKAHNLEPDNPYILDTYGVLLGRNGDNTRALDLLLKAKERLANNWDVNIHVIEVYIKLDRRQDARRELDMLSGQKGLSRERREQISTLKQRI